MAGEAEQQLRAYVEYLRDMGVHDFYRQGEPVHAETVSLAAIDTVAVAEDVVVEQSLPKTPVVERQVALVPIAVPVVPAPTASLPSRPQFLEPPIAKLVSFDDLVPL